jgi:hypothetical protein
MNQRDWEKIIRELKRKAMGRWVARRVMRCTEGSDESTNTGLEASLLCVVCSAPSKIRICVRAEYTWTRAGLFHPLISFISLIIRPSNIMASRHLAIESSVGSFLKHEDGPRRPKHQFGLLIRPGARWVWWLSGWSVFARENVGQPIIIAWLETNNQATSFGTKKNLDPTTTLMKTQLTYTLSIPL